MWTKIIGFIMSIIMFIGSLFGITGGNKGEADRVRETIEYGSDGKSFAVSVKENGTTGYLWNQKIEDEGVVKLVSDEYIAPSTDMVGAPGVRVYTYEGVAAGTTTIVLNYARSWEKGSADTMTITVEVAEDLTVTVNCGEDKNVSAPVGDNISEIVAYYNKAANDTKAYKGNMTLAIVEGASAKITDTSFPKVAMDIANKMLPNDYPTNKSYVVTNGQTADGQSINKILPIDDNEKMSTLSAGGVQAAICTKINDGYKVVIKLKAENVDSFSKQPVNHSSCMKCLDMTDDDLKPFVCSNCNICYTEGTISAFINKNGMLTELNINNPIHITGTLKWTAIQGTAIIDASWKQTVEFEY